jgi:signal recognition particle subunit SRP19
MPDHFFVYPSYLLRRTSRRMGRRLPHDAAVPDATVEDLLRAAKALGFEATSEPEKQYPREPYHDVGRVKVTKKKGVTKAIFLRQLADELRLHPPSEEGQ